MKKTAILLVLFIAYTLSSYAQKAKVRNATFNVMHLPLNPLKASVNTFSILTNNSSPKVQISSEQKSKYFNLQGFKKTDIPSSDIKMEFTIHAVQTSVGIKDKEESKKVDGKDVKITKYYYQITSKTISDFIIKYKSGEVIKKLNFNGGSYQYKKVSSLYGSRAQAQAAYNKSKKSLLTSANREGLVLVLKGIKTYLNNNHAYFSTREYGRIATGKGKKHDYTELDETFASFNTAAALISPNNVPQTVTSEFNKCIEIWIRTIDEYEEGNKKARISPKNIDAFHINIVVAYLYMNEFEKAREWTNKAMKVAKNDAAEKKMLKTINQKEKLFNLNQKREAEKKNIKPDTTTDSNTEEKEEKKAIPNTESEKNLDVQKTNPTNETVIKKEDSYPVKAMKGINSMYRVQKMRKIKNGVIRLTNFHYNGEKLAYTISTIKGLKIDSVAYTYESTRVTAQSFDYSNAEEKWYLEASTAENSIFYQVHNEALVSKIDGDQKVNYFYEKGKLTSVEVSTFALGKLKSLFRYSFVYAGNKITTVKVARKFGATWNDYENSTLTFNYSNSTVNNKINGMMFESDYRNGPLSRIQKYEKKDYDNPVYEYRRSYDDNKCIDNELVSFRDGKKVEYEVAYEKAKGNEKLFIGSRNWEINTFFNQISFFSEKDIK